MCVIQKTKRWWSFPVLRWPKGSEESGPTGNDLGKNDHGDATGSDGGSDVRMLWNLQADKTQSSTVLMISEMERGPARNPWWRQWKHLWRERPPREREEITQKHPGPGRANIHWDIKKVAIHKPTQIPLICFLPHLKIKLFSKEW